LSKETIGASRQRRLALVEVRKTVTVLFADVTGSTALGEHLDPESLRGVMSRYFDEMRSAVEAHGGTVEKFIGDAVMAVFGVPVVHEDDALRAVRAASQMREMLASLNAELDRDWGARIQIRIGVNTGEVVAGDASGGQTLVTGDAVNVAARLEQAADPGEILIGQETYQLVRDAVRAEPVEPLELKGKAERVSAFRLLEVTPGAPQFARRLDSPLVGRTEELARLQRAFEETTGLRACRVATVVGDAGTGKSRLVNEFVTLTGDRARALWGRCLPYGEGITFWPVAEVVKAAAGIGDLDSPESARTKVRELLADVEDGVVVADRVAAAIGLGEGGGDIRETFWAVRRLLEFLARDAPLVVIFEDIHWAEPTFLDLLQYVAGFSADHPMLLLCTSRPDIRETRPDWGNVGEVIALEPLSENECELLIGNLLGAAGLTGDVQLRITDAAEGNPLFVEEMLRKLIDEGHLERDNGHWTARGDLSRISVPGTISALLSARLDQLQSEERAVIQRASVVGKVFWWGAVTELSPEGDRSLVGSHLQTLMRKELVRPDRSGFAGEDAFRFSHILVRDAAYESMPKRARAELHERFASWLERKAGDRIAEFEEILGYHLEQAYRYRAELGPDDERARAVAGLAAQRLTAAGRRALAQWDVSATANLLSRAADLLPRDDPFRLEVLADLGLVLGRTDIPRADAVLTEAIERARASDDLRVEARAGVRRVFVRLLLDPQINQADALREVEGYAGLFEEWSDDQGLAEARSLIGAIRFWQGAVAVGEENFERAIVHARRAGDRRQEAEIVRWLTLVIDHGPTPAKEGIRRLESLLEQSHGDRRVAVGVTRARGALEAMRGRIEAAREDIARGKALTRELGDQVGFAGVLRTSGFVEMLAGDPASAEAEFRSGYEIYDRIGDVGHLTSLASGLGDAVYAQGRYDEALRIAEVVERITIEGDVDPEVLWRQLRAKILARKGRHDEAEALVRDAVLRAAATDFLDLRAHALRAQGEVLRLAGRSDEAASAVREARDLYRRKGHVVGEAQAASLLEELEA
jgi:class 3 adenylate cyclase/tetratricopeptide (TPR) repeat protein